MERDRRRRQTPSVHPGGRKSLISMGEAGLNEGGVTEMDCGRRGGGSVD